MAKRQGGGNAAGAVRVSNYPATLTVQKDTHRTGDRSRALSQYADIVESLLDVARRYPGLPESVGREIFQGIGQIQAMESETEVMEFGIPLSAARSFNRTLSAMQRELLPKLEIRPDGST